MVKKSQPSEISPVIEKTSKTTKSALHAQAPKTTKSALIKFLKEILIAILVVLIIRSLVAQLSLVPSGSMKPNLLEGDFVLVTKYNYGYSRYSLPLNLPLLPSRVFYKEPRMGDILVFKNPLNLEEEYVKRVIAKGGDTVQVINSVVYINDTAVVKKFLRFDYNMGVTYKVYQETLGDVSYLVWEMLSPYDYYRAEDFSRVINFGPLVVPTDSFFVLGDNRHNSQDSRFIGVIDKALLVGRPKVILISTVYAPINQFWRWVTEFRYDRFFKFLQ